MILTCNKKENRNSNIILKVGNGGIGPLTVLTPLTRELPVVSVSIDTIEMKHPSILLMFTTQINMPAELNVNLIFNIKRYIHNASPQTVGGSYVFSSVTEILEAKTFAFQFYDTDINPDKYTYVVEVSGNSFIGIAAGLTIANANLSALAVN